MVSGRTIDFVGFSSGLGSYLDHLAALGFIAVIAVDSGRRSCGRVAPHDMLRCHRLGRSCKQCSVLSLPPTASRRTPHDSTLSGMLCIRVCLKVGSSCYVQ